MSEPTKHSKEREVIGRVFGRIAHRVACEAGRPWVFILAATTVIVWAATGPIFAYSDTWQLVINTGTTIVTFLMVFLIQNSQNRDSAAIQVKLDELIRASDAKNAFVGVEHLSDTEIDRLRDLIERRVKHRREPNEKVEVKRADTPQSRSAARNPSAGREQKNKASVSKSA